MVPVGKRLCSGPSWRMTLTRVPAGLYIPLRVPDGIPFRACWLGSWQRTSHFWFLQEMAGAFEDWQGHCAHTLPTKVYEDSHLGPHSPLSHCQGTTIWCSMRATGIFQGTSSKLQGCGLPSLSLTPFETIFGILPESSHYLTTEWFLLSLIPLGEGTEARAPATQNGFLVQLLLPPPHSSRFVWQTWPWPLQPRASTKAWAWSRRCFTTVWR